MASEKKGHIYNYYFFHRMLIFFTGLPFSPMFACKILIKGLWNEAPGPGGAGIAFFEQFLALLPKKSEKSRYFS
jgi:hypothetical protein